MFLALEMTLPLLPSPEPGPLYNLSAAVSIVSRRSKLDCETRQLDFETGQTDFETEIVKLRSQILKLNKRIVKLNTQIVKPVL